MQISGLLPDVRNMINDASDNGNRWSSDKIAGFLCQAIALLNSMRPESRYINGVLTDIDFGNDPKVFEIPAEYSRTWIDGLVYFAASKCLEEDSTDTANAQLAVDFMSKATSRFQL